MGRFLLLLSVLLAYSCGVPIDPAERDFRVSLRQVETRASPSKRSIQRLLVDFDLVQAPDYIRVRALEQSDAPANWPERYTLYESMYARLLAVSAYFPLGAATNYRGGYGLNALDSLRETARWEAGKYFLDLADAAVLAARADSKPAAREAYGYLQRALDFLPERRSEYAALLAEMADRGTVRILMTLTGDAWLTALARQYAEGRGAVVDDWFLVETEDTGQAVDYEAQLQLVRYRTDGPNESSSDTRYTKEVLDYVEKQEYEVRINDSTVVTKVREIEHFKTITATVTQVVQEFEVVAYGELVTLDLRTGSRSVTSPVTGTEAWENEYSTCHGDPDALPPFACSGMREWPPQKLAMLRDAMHDLMNSALWKLHQEYAP